MLTTKLRFTSKRPLKTITITISDGFGPFLDGFGRFWIVFGAFRTVSDRVGPFLDRFRTVFGAFRTVLADFGALSDRFRTTPPKILKFQISIGQGWGPSVAFRPSVPSPPSPGQLKFEILTEIETKTKL